MNFEYFNFPNIGYLVADIPKDVEQILRHEISKVTEDFSKAKSASAGLAGHILKEYALHNSKQIVQDCVINLMSVYDKKCDYLNNLNILERSQKYFLDSLWVNFQEKHEFNPVHSHSGIMSFVIWLTVPYQFEQEDLVFSNKPKDRKRNGRFGFCYTNSLGKIQTQFINVDKKLENKICLFPSTLNHVVYPFYTSDECRVSVSGNIKFAFEQF